MLLLNKNLFTHKKMIKHFFAWKKTKQNKKYFIFSQWTEQKLEIFLNFVLFFRMGEGDCCVSGCSSTPNMCSCCYIHPSIHPSSGRNLKVRASTRWTFYKQKYLSSLKTLSGFLFFQKQIADQGNHCKFCFNYKLVIGYDC